MENFIMVFAAFAVYLLITTVFSDQLKSYDMIKHRLKSLKKINKEDILRDTDLDRPLTERLLKPISNSLLAYAKRLSSKTKKSKNNKDMEKLQNQLHSAGLVISAQEFTVLKFTFAVIGMLIVILVCTLTNQDGTNTLMYSVLGAGIPVVICAFGLKFKINGRKTQMEKQLPDIFDLLSISVEAGMGFDQALKYICDNMNGPLINELSVCVREMGLGKTQKEAFDSLAERCGIEQLTSFSGAVIQASTMGISMKSVLKSQAAMMRTARKNKVQEKAAKVSTKILLPMVGFIFPVLFIVLLGPAALNMSNLM